VTKKPKRSLARRHLMLDEEDMAFLDARFAANIGVSKLMRRLISSFVKNLQERELNVSAGPKPKSLKLDFDLE
jgi:hypothetical protein